MGYKMYVYIYPSIVDEVARLQWFCINIEGLHEVTKYGPHDWRQLIVQYAIQDQFVWDSVAYRMNGLSVTALYNIYRNIYIYVKLCSGNSYIGVNKWCIVRTGELV